VKRDTFFDLASLTKPLATTLAVMKLMLRSQVSLSRSLGSLITEFSETDKAVITVQQLLCHHSGLPDYRPYFQSLWQLPPHLRRDTLRTYLLEEPLICSPGEKGLYSDLGFMILQWAIERLAGNTLDRLVAEEIYRPLGLKDLFFIDLQAEKKKADYAATEYCTLRKCVLEGVVHDENAYVIGGVGGHAGLFGSARSVYRLLLELMRSFQGRDSACGFPKEIVRRFFERQQRSDRALGFDTPSAENSSSGRLFSPNSVGHLGFTGTSFWMDLDRSIIVILLTNRVHPTRNNTELKSFRPELHDLIMETMMLSD
jgi:CubicO group peptidase (beta-lactamase class C family)